MRNDTVLTQPASAAKAWWTVSLLIFRSRLSVILGWMRQQPARAYAVTDGFHLTWGTQMIFPE